VESRDPIQLAILAILALATIVQMLLRRNGNGKSSHGKPAGFSDIESGQLKEKVATLEREVQDFREWRDTKLATQYMPRPEIELLQRESAADRRRLWAMLEGTGRVRDDRREPRRDGRDDES
jgi:hypothetical protein